MLLRFRCRFFCSINYMINPNQHENGIFRTKTRLLKDRYDLHKLTRFEYMCHLATSEKHNFRLNQKIALFYRMVQVALIKKVKLKYFPQMGNLIGKIRSDFADPEDYACLGTFMTALVKLNNYQPILWQEIVEWISQNKYDDEYDEIYAIVTSFELVGDFCDSDYVKPRIVQVLRKLLEITILHIKQKRYNRKQMRKICRCMHKYGIVEKYFWEEVEFWFRKNLQQLDKEPLQSFFIMSQAQVQKEIFNDMICPVPILEQLNQIASSLSANGFPVLEFVEFTEKLIIFSLKQGKLTYQKYVKLKEQEQQAKSNSKTQQQISNSAQAQLSQQYRVIFIDAIQIYNQSVIHYLYALRKTLKTFQQHTGDPVIIRWLGNQIKKQYNRFSMNQILIMNQSAQFLGFDRQQKQFLLSLKIGTMRDEKQINMDDLKNMIQLVEKIRLTQLERTVIKFIQNSQPSGIIPFTNFMEQYLPYMPVYFIELPRIVNKHYKYFSFDENCYFFYILVTNKPYWQSYNLLQYEGELQNLKQTIKITAFQRGFKINMDSYFFKLLNYIDIAQFFDGGN